MPDPFCSECIRLQRENSELSERLNQMIEDEEHLDVGELLDRLKAMRDEFGPEYGHRHVMEAVLVTVRDWAGLEDQ